MKKIKIFAVYLLFVAAAVTGYKSWKNSHLTPEEALMKANIEALANAEEGDAHPLCFMCTWSFQYDCLMYWSDGTTTICEHAYPPQY